jgi:hypothetical protein
MFRIRPLIAVSGLFIAGTVMAAAPAWAGVSPPQHEVVPQGIQGTGQSAPRGGPAVIPQGINGSGKSAARPGAKGIPEGIQGTGKSATRGGTTPDGIQGSG